MFGRRSFLLCFPQAALTVACALGSTRATRVGDDATSEAGKASATSEAGGERVAPETPVPTAASATPEQMATSRRAQPLPVPPEEERWWLQEWLDLISLNSRKADVGC